MEITVAELTAVIGGYFWPLLRVGAMLMVAPFFGSSMVPARVRLALGLAVTWALYPLLPAAPAVDPASVAGIAIAANQLLLGVAMGLILQLAFAALTVGAHNLAMTMGLGFAQFIDPDGIPSVVLNQFFMLLGTLLFLALNGHQLAIMVLKESFDTLPVGAPGPMSGGALDLVLWGGRMFAGGLLIALPAVLAITVVNLAFGVMSRAAPQFNVFGVLFPITLLAGFIVLAMTLPALLPRFASLLMDGFDFIEQRLSST